MLIPRPAVSPLTGARMPTLKRTPLSIASDRDLTSSVRTHDCEKYVRSSICANCPRITSRSRRSDPTTAVASCTYRAADHGQGLRRMEPDLLIRKPDPVGRRGARVLITAHVRALPVKPLFTGVFGEVVL
jgi:hypothetical protein